ncbi:MAG: hypothetical protein K2X66_10410, partial [Cyanobacteria bacterium]|nr:hypothetical protein [Cyanobacteriota bacterium]
TGGNILQPKSPPRIIAATVMISPLVLKVQGNHQVGWDVRQNFPAHVQKFLALVSAEIPTTPLENPRESKDFDEKKHEISFALTPASHSGHRGAGGSKVSGVSGAHASGSESSNPLHITQDPEKPYWVHCWTIAKETSPSSSEGSESQLAQVEAATEKMASLYHGLHPGPVPASLTQAQKSSHLMDQQLQEMEEKLQTLQLQAKGGKHLYTQEALHLQSSLYLQSMLSVSKSMQGSLHQRYKGLSKELGLGQDQSGKRNKNLSLGQIHALWVQNQTVAKLQRQLAQTVVAHEKTKLALGKSAMENASATSSDEGSPPGKAQDVDTLALQESMIAKLHQEIQVAEAQANDLKKPPVASSLTYVSHQPGPHSGDSQKDVNLHPAVDTHPDSTQSGPGSSVDELATLIEKVPTLQQENAMLASLMETDVKLKANWLVCKDICIPESAELSAP